MEKCYSKAVLYFPIRVYLIFFIFTLLLFVFGPVAWKVPSYGYVSIYLIICNLALYIGYSMAVQKYKIIHNPNFEIKLDRLFKTCLIISIIFIIPKFFLRWDVNSISLSSFINTIQDGLTKPSSVYYDKVEKMEMHESSTTMRNIIGFIFSPWLFAFFPLAVRCFKNYRLTVKIFIIIIFISEILSWIGIGTNKGLLDIILVTAFIIFYEKHQFILNNFKKAIIPTIIILISFLIFFMNTQISRLGLKGDLNLDMASNFIDFKLLGFYNNIPAVIALSLAMVSGYLNQGYYALSLALQTPMVWSYGFGNSFFTIKIWQALTGTDLMKSNYIGQLHQMYGLDPTVNWHSFYVWCASDFTFPGVVILVFVIGYVLGLSWLDILHDRSAYASVIFSLFIIMVFYFFANNQVLSFSFFPFFYFLFRWLYDRKLKHEPELVNTE